MISAACDAIADLCACGCGTAPRKPGAQYVRGHNPGRSIAERLWSRVDKKGECWVWLGHRGRAGYGYIGRGRKSEGIALVHRVAYELEVGPIPDGLFVCHRCDNPPCVRPDHLFVGTQQDNMRDALLKGRTRGASGLRNWNARLTSEEVARVRQLDAAGMERKKTARLFGITPQHVGAIARNQIRRAA